MALGAADFLLINPFDDSHIKIKRLAKPGGMKTKDFERSIKLESSLELGQKYSMPTLPIIPLKIQNPQLHLSMKSKSQEGKIYDSPNEERVIPGYNFQSLFRKKSHIRLARKKNKEETQKKNSCIKLQNAEKEAKNTQKGHWTHQENKLYHWFLEIHNRHFILKYLRRTDKIFKSMANFIRTREAEQCRSHHQKMQKKYRNFHQILLKLRMQFYHTASPELLQLQLRESGYAIKDYTIISEQELKNGNEVKLEYKGEDNQQENSIRNSIDDNEDQSKQQNSLLGENYQKGLQFNLKYQ